MITRKALRLISFSLCLSLITVVNADSNKPAAKSEKKPAMPVLSERKASHPCARKSVRQLNKKAQPFQQAISASAKKYGVDGDLVKSVITIESCYKQKALSPKSAQGLMQLIPATAARFGVSDVYDAGQNIRAGTQYLSWLSKRFNGDLQKVLAGYNAGEGKVDRYKGIPPYRETRNYVHDVLLVYKKFKAQDKQLVKAAAAKHQAKLAADYKRQQQARQRAVQLAEQRKLAAMTPDQRRRFARQVQLAQQVRQRQQSARQRQLVAQVRQRDQRRAILTANQANPTHEIITGQVSRPISEAVTPVLRKASSQVVGTPVTAAPQAQQGEARVQQTYRSPFKPGRAGWQVNKQRAPQLYKQQ